ncbi:MAG: dihydrofolate reductase [Clostridia bacterium]|nr:dihydrofolate reductase [Clostridia bacterium]
MKLIVAVDKEWGIGNKGDLLARIRADLMNFKSLTSGKVVVLGSNTLATFPGGKALKNRINIVLHPSEEYHPDNTTVVHSIDQLLEEVKKYDTDDIIIIGGASVYRQMLPYCDTAYVTKFDKSFEKDVYFPNLDEDENWELAEIGDKQVSDPETDTEGGLEFYFTKYVRK